MTRGIHLYSYSYLHLDHRLHAFVTTTAYYSSTAVLVCELLAHLEAPLHLLLVEDVASGRKKLPAGLPRYGNPTGGHERLCRAGRPAGRRSTEGR